MKKLFLLAAICAATTTAYTQSFQHGVGLGVYIENMDYVDVLVGSTITYSPRINFAETGKMSISVGIPLTIGYAENYGEAYDYDDYDDYYYSYFKNSVSLLVDVPVMVNLNLWGGASKLSKQHIGAFIGAGYGYHYVTERKYGGYNEDGVFVLGSTGGNSFGPSFNGGMRIAVGRRRSKNIEIKMSYYSRMNANRIDSYGIGAAFNF